MTALFVTALYDLKTIEKSSARRSLSEYYKYKDYLCSLTQPLIIFTEPHLEPELKQLFESSSHIQIMTLPWDKLRYMDQIGQIRINMNLHPFQTDNANKTTAAYSVMMWNKFEFVYKSYQLFPTYDKYIWIDFGLGGVVKDHACSMNDVLKQFDDTHFCCTIINPLVPSEYDSLDECYGSWKYRQVGGFWSIGRNGIEFFVSFLRNEIESLLRMGRVCMDEEVMARFSYTHQDRCRFSFGDYGSCVVNWIGLKHDMHVTRRAIDKAHRFGRHLMAVTGFEKLLQSYSSKILQWSISDVMFLLMSYYIEMYYVDKPKSRAIAIKIMHMVNEHSEAHDYYVNNTSHMKLNFSYVLTDNEWEDLSPSTSCPATLEQISGCFKESKIELSRSSVGEE